MLGVYQYRAKGTSALSVEGGESVAGATSRVDFVSYLVQRVIYWPARGLNGVADAVGRQAAGFWQASALEAKVRGLEERLAEAEKSKVLAEDLQRQVDELRKLQSLPTFPGRNKVSANIAGYFPTQQRIMLDVGRSSGVSPSDPVVAPEGLLGQVVEVSPKTCFVNLLNSADFSIGARVLRAAGQEVGIAEGQMSDQLLLSVYDEGAQVASGDLITTSGLSTIYPSGIPIGRVTKTWENKNLGIRQALVLPNVRIADLRAAVVLTK